MYFHLYSLLLSFLRKSKTIQKQKMRKMGQIKVGLRSNLIFLLLPAALKILMNLHTHLEKIKHSGN